MQISCDVTAQLIRAFVFEFAINRFSTDEAHMADKIMNVSYYSKRWK